MNQPRHASWHPLLGTLCVLALVAHPTFPCSRVRLAPERVWAQHYVFEGIVRAVAAPMEPAYLAGPAWGLSVEVSSVIQAPHTLGALVRVYPFDGYSASCTWIGLPLERIDQQFPVGTKIHIIATAYPASQRVTESLPTRLYSEAPIHMKQL